MTVFQRTAMSYKRALALCLVGTYVFGHLARAALPVLAWVMLMIAGMVTSWLPWWAVIGGWAFTGPAAFALARSAPMFTDTIDDTPRIDRVLRWARLNPRTLDPFVE